MRMMKVRLKIILIISFAAVFTLGAVMLYFGVLPYRVYAVRTGSMKPAIPPRSAVVVRASDYKIGQPVTVMHDGSLVTHRLLAVDANGMTTTKGDANAKPDTWHVPTDNIVGGVVAAPKMLGYWLVYLKNPIGLSSVLVAILSIWLIWDLAAASEKKRAVRLVPIDGLQIAKRPTTGGRSAAL